VQPIPHLEAPPAAPLSLDALRERLRPFCLQNPVEKLEVFGSVARGEAGAQSDVDLLVTFAPSARFGMFVFLDLKSELEGLLGCAVDLLERPAVESSRNRFLKHYILRSARTIYERA
jgi:predicted nucleotidyltransferase